MIRFTLLRSPSTARAATLAALFALSALSAPAQAQPKPDQSRSDESKPHPAQSSPTEPGPAHTARLFDLLCISKLPDIDAIAKIAQAQNFAPVTGDELKPYQPQVPAEVLKVWHFRDLGARFTLVVARSRPDDQFKSSYPAFADSTNYACSLIPASGGPAAKTIAEMAGLIGRDADQSFEQGPLTVHTWLAQSETSMVQAFHYAIKENGTTRLLSATIFVKN